MIYTISKKKINKNVLIVPSVVFKRDTFLNLIDVLINKKRNFCKVVKDPFFYGKEFWSNRHSESLRYNQLE